MSDLWFYGDWTRPKYGQRHRHYHTHTHIDVMFATLEKFRSMLDEDEFSALETAIEFHDAVWQPDRTDNEERSIALARHVGALDRLGLVEGLIRATKAPFEPKTDLERLMVWIDWAHFLADAPTAHRINMAIAREYQMHSWAEYVKGRNAFFQSARQVPGKLHSKYITLNMVDDLVAGINRSERLSHGYRPKIGIFVGSFNPFHDGHYETVKSAERFYDKVILVQAVNSAKAANGLPEPFPPFIMRYYETHQFADGIEMRWSLDKILAHITTPELADYTLIRGIRNGTDLQDEQLKMRYYRDMGINIPIHHLLSDAEHQHISSSAVRELRNLGHNLYTKIWDYDAADDTSFD